jgi:hypothetical protein
MVMALVANPSKCEQRIILLQVVCPDCSGRLFCRICCSARVGSAAACRVGSAERGSRFFVGATKPSGY